MAIKPWASSSMHIIIDGYNVLKQVIHQATISESQRRGFINTLGKYANKKNHTITVVFDGGPTIWPSHEKDHGVMVTYVGVKQTADDYIKSMIENKRHGLLVVSSDNEIKRAAAHQGLVSVAGMEFYQMVIASLQTVGAKSSQKNVVKTSSEKNELVDQLMRKESGNIFKKDDEHMDERRSKGDKSSKKEREYLQKLKKL